MNSRPSVPRKWGIEENGRKRNALLVLIYGMIHILSLALALTLSHALALVLALSLFLR